MTIAQFNKLPETELRATLFKCCGSTVWVDKMLEVVPVKDVAALEEQADEMWQQCTEKDWLEAFTHHPKIGDMDSLKKRFATTANWASTEQSGVNAASDEVLNGLAKGNFDYVEKFGYIFIVCATGKSAPEMLSLLSVRLHNDPEDEIKVAAGEQSKITHLRLKRLFE